MSNKSFFADLAVGGIVLAAAAALIVINAEPSASSNDVVAAQTPCSRNWSLCKTYEEYFDTLSYDAKFKMAFDCRWEAERMARYGKPQWPSPFFDGIYSKGEIKLGGDVHLVEKDARFQNGFGVYGRTRVDCVYNLGTKKVVNITIAD